MAGFRNFVTGCALSAASIITPVASAQAIPLAVPDLSIDQPTEVQYYRRDHGNSYRDYRPYYGDRGYYRPYGHYRPYGYYSPGGLSIWLSF